MFSEGEGRKKFISYHFKVSQVYWYAPVPVQGKHHQWIDKIGTKSQATHWFQWSPRQQRVYPTYNGNQKADVMHYENMPMQYTEIFKVVKIENFQQKKDMLFFLSLRKT